LLLLLTFGAYIPPGFMPAAGTPFLLELCPAAAPLPPSMAMNMDMPMDMSMPMDMPMDTPMDMSMPMDMSGAAPPRAPDDTHQRSSQPDQNQNQHQHQHQHAHFENCPFGSAPAAGPLSQGIAFTPPVPVTVPFLWLFEPPRIASRPPRAHQARGPPSSA